MESHRSIIFFDGICNLCNSFIDHIIKNDKKSHFYVASLQGNTAQKHLNEKDRQSMSSVILLEGCKTFYKSSAIFRIALKLGGLYWLILPFWIIPRPLTNIIYDLVAHNRYRVFGKKSFCRLPTESEQKHFLD